MGAVSLCAQAQNPRIVLQGTGDPQVFSTIDDALAAAQPNDKLYFSGGTFTSGNGGITVDMPLHWIGAGISPDSTNVTAQTTLRTLNEHITFTNDANGSSFTGIQFYPDGGNTFNGDIFRFGTSTSDDAPQNMVFERCSFYCYVGLGKRDAGNGPDPTLPSSNSSFNECVFFGEVNGSGITSTTFTRCDLGSYINDFTPSGLYVDHSTVRYYFTTCDGFIAKNSVIEGSDYGALTSSGTMNNCLLVAGTAADAGSIVTTSSNIYSQVLGSIFVSDVDNIFQWSDDLHLASGSPGISAADDGTNIGIYGSTSPFKAGAVPYNPHYQQATIATSTNPNGELPVSIRVAAQPN